MMREELEQRVGKLEDWQWEMAHYVYQNNPNIKDVGGKDQIAEIIKKQDGWESYHVKDNTGLIKRLYVELKGPPIIIKHEQDRYTTYDVTHEHLCINTRPRPATVVSKEIETEYYQKHPELKEGVDYYAGPDFDVRHKNIPNEWPLYSRIAVYYVRGGSEGYYVHVDTQKNGQFFNMILIKTLREGEAGISWAEQTVCALSRIMEV